jgi:F-type H+-transporting ATPase subunit a
MEQFQVKPIIPLHIGGYDVSFTNQSLWMCVVVGAVSLFMAVAVSNRRLVPSRMQSMAEMSYEFVANMINMTAGRARSR